LQQKSEDEKPAVEDFVPQIPKSLLQLVVSVSSGGSGGLQLATSQSNQLTPEFAKLTRESRRCHVSGFSPFTTKQDLASFFTVLTQDVRRSMTEREVGRTLAPNLIVDIDHVIDVSVDSSKMKPFGFVELDNADMISELVHMCEDGDRDSRLLFSSARDSSTRTALTLRRPKDFVCPTAVDYFKVVLQGISPLVSEERMKSVMDDFGADMSTFQRNERFVYCEFEDEETAKECVEDLHGQSLSGRLIIAQHVTDPLRGLLMQAGFKVSAKKVSTTASSSGGKDGGVVGFDGMSGNTRDHVREVLELTTTLNQAVRNLKDTFPHLEPQFGTNLPVFPTRILVLLNAIDEEELESDESYSRLLQDLSAELERYGRIKHDVIVPRRLPLPVAPKPLPPRQAKPPAPKTVDVLPLHNPFDDSPTAAAAEHGAATAAGGRNEEEEDEADDERRFQALKEKFLKDREEWQQKVHHPVYGGVGRVFVEYETIDEAIAAQRAISGRLFRMRTVITSFLFEDVLYPPVEEDEAAAQAAADASVEAYLRTAAGGADAEELRDDGDPKATTTVEGEGDRSNAEDLD
jgi:hypothetical protein